MSFADTIKGLIFKKPAQPADPRRAPDSVMEGGRGGGGGRRHRPDRGNEGVQGGEV